jgi:thioredoxin reductase (NADPH)
MIFEAGAAVQFCAPARTYDCIIVGGGPAGLTAAIYLARFHLSVLVIDAGSSRTAMIPLTRNHAGFPEGINGQALLERMGDQAKRYGAAIEDGEVTRLRAGPDTFTVTTVFGAFVARSVLLATGVVNRRPDMSEADHDSALQRGLLRYCPICDGFEVTDKRIGVIGSGEHGAKEALFLRSFSADVTLLDDGSGEMPHKLAEEIAAAGIAKMQGPVGTITIGKDVISVETAAGKLAFDTLYPALGSDIRSELAVALGAEASGEGCLTVDRHQRTSVSRLYAAGDVVLGLDQISHAMGEGGVAATTIRNDLAEQSPLRRASTPVADPDTR